MVSLSPIARDTFTYRTVPPVAIVQVVGTSVIAGELSSDHLGHIHSLSDYTSLGRVQSSSRSTGSSVVKEEERINVQAVIDFPRPKVGKEIDGGADGSLRGE